MKGFFQCITEADRIGTAVAFNHHTAQAEEYGAVEFARIQFVFETFQGRHGGQRTQFGQQIGLKFLLDCRTHKTHRAFYGFQYDVADKAVGHHDIHIAAENAAALDIADKVQLAAAEEFENLFDGIRAFDVFGTDIQQTDTRRARIRIQCVHQFAADNGKLHQLLGCAVHVCAQIKHQRHVAVLRGDEFGNCRPLDALYGFQHKACGCHQRTRIARRHRCLRQTFLHLIHGYPHGGIFFVFQGRLGLLIHLDHLCGMDDLNAVHRCIGSFQCLPNLHLVAHHQ